VVVKSVEAHGWLSLARILREGRNVSALAKTKKGYL
jgi:hypothetical protein